MLGNIRTEFWDAVAGVFFLALTAFFVWVRKLIKSLINRIESKSPSTPIRITVKQDIEINVLLDRLRRDLSAQRVHVTRFSNGDHFIGGGSIIRLIRTHERVKPGVSFQTENFRGMVLNSVVNEVKLVLDEGPSFTLVSALPDCKFRQLCEDGATVAIARCAIFRDGQPVGFVGADFDDIHPPDPASLGEVCIVARKVGIIISGVLDKTAMSMVEESGPSLLHADVRVLATA